ncbi:CHRD domain-containing protein [Hymenobacter rubripertinctus]|uniref:CHRD domain-containing protein n=1 Tax=Hymenobacter rubripertinctus TaxID=2029981 RepID=A0A418QQ28_9BACT|nr:CHRD domain-containing protein [Hymenobacter rubripertinctus]RIY07150.1 CHRD domain-containing protein [Hymenobacter rubripertinctus]
MRTIFTSCFVLLSLLLGIGPVQADHLRAHLLLGAQLSGAQEVPAVTTSARGVVSFTLNPGKDTLFISGAFAGLSGPVKGAHVHSGFEGVAGAIVTNLLPFVQGNRIQGFLTGTDLDRAKLDRYLRGGYYINIHTDANPGGEIRGQIRLEKDEEYTAELLGSQEVPPVVTNASGYGTFSLSQQQDKLRFRVILSGLSGPVVNTHFHKGAAGTSGAVIVDLKPYLSGNVIEGEITPTAEFLAALAIGQIYINVHTAANTGGEIRSQLVREARFLNHDARLDGAQMVPATASAAKAVAFFQLNTTLDTLLVSVAHTGLSSAPLTLDLYAANAGQANGPTLRIGSLNLVGAPSEFGFRIVSPGIALVNLFLTGTVNMVLTTTANPAGEIRGQVYRLAREGYTFGMSGAQERPTPVATAGYGAGFVSMDRDQSNVHVAASWGDLSGAATGGHLHTGLSTESGPVVFDLMPFFNAATPPNALDAYWNATNASPNDARPFTSRRALQFRRDSLYVNLHTVAKPGGEIRGQVTRDFRKVNLVLATQPAVVAAETFVAAPNPFQNEVQVRFQARASGSGTIRVTDLLGRTILTRSLAVRPGANTTELRISGASGMYVLTLDVGGSRVVSRITKQ